MSLFDVIKYPISDIPTKEELSALPQDLYAIWLAYPGTHWSRYSSYFKYSPLEVANWMAAGHAHQEDEISHDVFILRKLIREY